MPPSPPRAKPMLLEVRSADLLTFEGDAILVPINCEGTMEDEISSRVKEITGPEIEQQVISHQPIAIGAALVTDAPNLPCGRLIHAPMIETAGLRMSIENIRRGTRASLLASVRYEMERIGITGVGYEEGGVSHEEAARAIIDEITGFKGPFPGGVCLLDEDPDMNEAFAMLAGGR